jgi:hypothetical protein
MQKTLLSLAMSALLGGVAGASAAAWFLRDAPAPSTPVAHNTGTLDAIEHPGVDAPLLERIERIEHTIRAIQARGAPTERARRGQESTTEVAASSVGPASAAPQANDAPLVNDPVFEAAVLDILERAEDDRSSERDVRRTERAHQQAEHWTKELTTRLALSSTQAAKLLEIRTQLASDLRERRRDVAGGPFVPREQRRAAVAALRERAERELRKVLEPQQVARYDELEAELKIVRPPDSD